MKSSILTLNCSIDQGLLLSKISPYNTGSYCPTGSSGPTPCPAGKYTNATRTVTCLDCPIGHYCVLGTSDPVPCPEGFWCPVSSTAANLHPCAIGTFLNTTGGQKAADCLSCSPG